MKLYNQDKSFIEKINGLKSKASQLFDVSACKCEMHLFVPLIKSNVCDDDDWKKLLMKKSLLQLKIKILITALHWNCYTCIF